MRSFQVRWQIKGSADSGVVASTGRKHLQCVLLSATLSNKQSKESSKGELKTSKKKKKICFYSVHTVKVLKDQHLVAMIRGLIIYKSAYKAYRTGKFKDGS